MDPTLYDEIASVFKDQGRLSAGFLIAGIEGEPISLDEGVMHGVLVAVDEGDRIPPVQEKVTGIIVPSLLQHDSDSARQVGLRGTERE
ncbi:hypothetical protein MKK75_18950 [Methylobacterium sp. J-030]|uniref:hypothetical protein n=1 Tax=Methylobacterium sp. J-030 TaxID=2836627 RepID=UPI001FBBCA6B|nr:hypothetical protein [Methylobacterium sp. J-030]MCJ2070842.1 hypothetical protein [Methylobacterium sp. J-030]